jgi:predicted polyphosphate/ATP-dependent NAD kinase
VNLVGIIANPASGKDIRRLVSQATTVNNQEKVNIVRRLLVALCATGVRQVQIMPDLFGIGGRALDGLRDHPEARAAASIIDMPLTGTAADSLRAAQYLREAGAGCIVVLGGDGTCRVVAKGLALDSSGERPGSLLEGCSDVPLLPISTGTNNVVPAFVEGTIAGLAAAYVAGHPHAERERFCRRHKRLLVYVNGDIVDCALVDVALIATPFTGSRAVWRSELLRQVFVTRAQPSAIGASAVLGALRPVGPGDPIGAAATLGRDGQKVLTPLAPGYLVPVDVGEVVDLQPSVRHRVLGLRPAVLALDGERELPLRDGDCAEVALSLDGPWIVDVARAMEAAASDGMFTLQDGQAQTS